MMVKRETNIMNNHVLLAAILLDPRFNVILNEKQSDIAIKHLKNVWVYLKQIESEKMQSSSTTIIHEQEILSDLVDSDALEMYLRNQEDSSQSSNFGNLSNSQASTMGKKIETLLKSFCIENKRLSYKTNILQFRDSKKTIYPELFKISNIILSVPATQVSVERLFSGLKYILSPYRINISAKNLEDQLLIRTNRLFENKKCV